MLIFEIMWAERERERERKREREGDREMKNESMSDGKMMRDKDRKRERERDDGRGHNGREGERERVTTADKSAADPACRSWHEYDVCLHEKRELRRPVSDVLVGMSSRLDYYFYLQNQIA